MDKDSKTYEYMKKIYEEELSHKVDNIIEEWHLYKEKYGVGTNFDEISAVQAHLNEDKRWKSIILYAYSYSNDKVLAHFPTLKSFIDRNRKHINLIMFSTTEAGKIIPTHKGGNSQGILRMQLGIDIVEPDKCYLQVENKKTYLKEREIFMFDDMLEHKLVNDSSFNRTVLLIDFFKKLPWLDDIKSRKNIRKMRKTEYVQSVIKQFN